MSINYTQKMGWANKIYNIFCPCEYTIPDAISILF